jgi:hypothetical protein
LIFILLRRPLEGVLFLPLSAFVFFLYFSGKGELVVVLFERPRERETMRENGEMESLIGLEASEGEAGHPFKSAKAARRCWPRLRCKTGGCDARQLLAAIAVALVVQTLAVVLLVAVITTDSLEVVQAAREVMPSVKELISRLDQILSHIKWSEVPPFPTPECSCARVVEAGR